MATSDLTSARHHRSVFFYFGGLTLVLSLGSPQGMLLDIATSFMLKNQLHASAPQISLFRLLTALPVYLSIIFGFTRDLWNPLKRHDRGFFMIFAPLTALVFLWLAFWPLSYAGLFGGMMAAMLCYRFIAAAYQGLLALVGQEQLMSGRLSALWNIVGSIPAIAGAAASGWVAEHLPPRQTFLLLAAFMALVFLFGLIKPRAVFEHAYDLPQARGANLWGDIKRLLAQRAVYPAVLIMFMFQFSPGSSTPLQFYLTNNLHASDEMYGYFNAIFAASFIPVFFLYGYICRFVSLKKLLWWGMIITVPQMVPLAFIHTAGQALLLAAPIGLMGGIAGAAIYDLAIRSCPPGMQGALMMMIDGVSILSMRGGDLVGSKIFSLSPSHGFLYCVIATTIVYALILPVLLLIPKQIIATSDGEVNTAVS